MRQVTLTGDANIGLFFETALVPFDGKIARPEALRLVYGENDDDLQQYELFATADCQGEPFGVLEASYVTSELIQYHIARAYFAVSWIKQLEPVAGPILADAVLRWVVPEDAPGKMGVVNFEELPEEISREAFDAAAGLAKALLECNKANSLAELYQLRVSRREGQASEKMLSFPAFGHFLGMSAMGYTGGLDAFGVETCGQPRS